MQRVRRYLFLQFIITVAVLLSPSQLMAVDAVSPIIGGFERFARHEDIAPEVSGSLLIAELSCTACHASTQPSLQPKAGPKLEAVGRRLHPTWMAAFLDAPSATKPGTTMPDVLGHLDAAAKQRAVAALVAFLSSQQAAFPDLKATGANPVPHEFWNKGNISTGRRLMHQSGCVACHEPHADYQGGVRTTSTIDRLLEELEPEDIAKLGLTHAMRSVASIPLPDLQAKYTPQGLSMFLLEPALVRPSGRMPNMKLGTTAAADIAAYLISKSADAPAAAGPVPSVHSSIASPQLRGEGQRLFGELGCVQCHSAAAVAPHAKSKPLAALNLSVDRSCISEAHHVRVPHFAVDEMQRAAITAAIRAEQGRAANGQSNKALANTADARVHFTLMQLNCYACHQRDGAGGLARGRDSFFETLGQVDLGDEGRLPPPLTGVGRKLNSAWLKRVLQGTGDVRPHLQIRMPKYPPAEVEPLGPLLLAADMPAGASQPSIRGPTPGTAIDRALADTGRAIFNVGCVQCHPVRGESLPSVVGIDVGHIGARVQRQWFHDFLLDPASLKPRTRMPTFFAEGSVNQDFLEGDVEQQIAALWAYLEDVDRQPLPEKIEQVRRQNFELIPTERPIVLRTFMEHAGTHAIAVGFPQRLHYAFDTETVRLSDVWRGRFLDAQGTWNDRFAPNALPLSQSSAVLPAGVEFALLSSPGAVWPTAVLDAASRGSSDRSSATFLGYRLDKDGNPEFRYRVGDYQIVDRITPATVPLDTKNELRSLVREFTITLDKLSPPAPETAPPAQLWFRAAAGARLQRVGNDACSTDSGLTIFLPVELAKTALIRQSNGQSQWLAPLPPASETNFKIEMRW